MAWRIAAAFSVSVAWKVTAVPYGQGAASSARTSASASPRKCSGASATRHPGAGVPSALRGRDETVQPRRARLSIPMPAASSRRTRSSLQPFSPRMSSNTAASAMPAPWSVTVTVSGPPASGPVTETKIRAAPARRLFCKVSVKMSARVAANVLVTRLMALS